jgi:hypothetical protein
MSQDTLEEQYGAFCIMLLLQYMRQETKILLKNK